jgi:hypothetical protein
VHRESVDFSIAVGGEHQAVTFPLAGQANAITLLQLPPVSHRMRHHECGLLGAATVATTADLPSS